MIAWLHGEVVELDEHSAVIACQGVGYGLQVTAAAAAHMAVGAKATVWVYTQVGADVLRLFGFVDALERQAFVLLLGVGQVGPRLAIAIVSALGAAGLGEALATDDHRALQAIAGVGKRTAERIVLELKGKAGQLLSADGAAGRSTAQGSAAGAFGRGQDLISALVNLGFAAANAESAARQALAQEDASAPLMTLMRRALQLVAEPKRPRP